MKKRKKISFKKILSRKDEKETISTELKTAKTEPQKQIDIPAKKEETKGKGVEDKKSEERKVTKPKEVIEKSDERKISLKREEIMIVRVENEFYGIPLLCVEEIKNEIKLTQTPQLSEFLSGIAEIRDLIVPVINLGKLFGIETENKKSNKIPVIVVKISNQFVGIQVSKIVEIIEIQKTEILPLPDIFPPKLFSGGFSHKSIVVGIINIESLLKGKQIQSFKEKIDEAIK
ncbi:chemotaxis protein CheW [candidate division WOR-3 bacterium]|nr:chemotaxis protein CheW [candidate division WOR-3 bacterium]